MSHVSTVATPLSWAQALGFLLDAGVPQSGLSMVGAQSAVETNGWGARTGTGFHNFNFGNITPSGAQLASGIDWMDQGIRGMKYISYADARAGARDYVTFLQHRGLFDFAVSRNLDGYTARLAGICYLGCIGNTDPTGHTVSDNDYAQYRAGIASWMTRLDAVTPEMPSGGGGIAAITHLRARDWLLIAGGVASAVVIGAIVYDAMTRR